MRPRPDWKARLTSFSKRNELPRSKLTGYQNPAMRIWPKGVTPECLNRGSSSGLACGEPSRTTDRSIRE